MNAFVYVACPACPDAERSVLVECDLHREVNAYFGMTFEHPALNAPDIAEAARIGKIHARCEALEHAGRGRELVLECSRAQHQQVLLLALIAALSREGRMTVRAAQNGGERG